jgi:hypothetical protein
VDLNQLYFDHQVQLIRAERAPTSAVRRNHEVEAAVIAGRIGQRQIKLGAAASCAWMARSWRHPA